MSSGGGGGSAGFGSGANYTSRYSNPGPVQTSTGKITISELTLGIPGMVGDVLHVTFFFFF